jgi:PmbA protein
LNHLFDAIAGSSIYRRSSFLVDRIGETIAAPEITVLDDARLPGALGSSPFDDEGVPTQTTPIIENGVLRNYLHSAYTARKLGTRPTEMEAVPALVRYHRPNELLSKKRQAFSRRNHRIGQGFVVVELIGFRSTR